MNKNIEIETNRLLLRVPTLDDAQEINDAINDVWHHLQMWMSWTHDGQNTLDATKSYINGIDGMVANGALPLFGFCKVDGKFAVASGFVKANDKLETGYWVARDFLGKGYASESCNAMTRFAFDELNVEEFHINHYEGNDKSKRIIEKLGFTPIGISAKAHNRCLDGTPLDIHHYVRKNANGLPPLDVRWRL